MHLPASIILINDTLVNQKPFTSSFYYDVVLKVKMLNICSSLLNVRFGILL